jgi:hypothetical protein
LIYLFEEMNYTRRAAILWQKLKDGIQNLNIFASVPSSIDENELRTERISTRLFIFLWIFSMTILLLYTSLIISTKTFTVKTPSFADYSDLYSTYNQSLTCPCSNISITYNKFIRVEYTLHQVCSSIFVDETWIGYVLRPVGTDFVVDDFRMNSIPTFQAIKMLCKLINSTIFNSLTRFNSSQYVSAFVVPKESLRTQIESLTDKFHSSIANTFSLSFAMIQDTTQANALFSIRQTNYYPTIGPDGLHIFMNQKSYNGCECVISSECAVPARFYKDRDALEFFSVANFYVGCNLLMSLLQSTLECFYDESCLDQLKSHIVSSLPLNVSTLDGSLSNRYSANSTIQELVDNLMIEEWNVSTLYERYYNECKPIQCIYKIERRNDIIYIVTTLFGIVGGLSTVLRFVVPKFVKLAMYYVRKHRMTVVPETVLVET